MDIKILTLNQLEKKEVQAFIEKNIHDKAYTSILSWPSLIKVFGASIHGRIAGLIIAWKSSFHPYCTYFKLAVPETPEAEAIAEQLLYKLRINSEYPLQTSIWETEYLKQFFENKGLQLIRKTYIPTVAVDSLIMKAEALSKNKYFNLIEVAENQELKNRLIQLTKQTYEETHIANPVAEFEDNTWEKLLFAEDVLMDLSYCVVGESQEILAFSYLHEDTAHQVELGWCGFIGKNEQELLRIVSLQVEQAKQKGYQYVTGEFDSTSPYAMFIYQNLHFPETGSWNTYQLKNSIEEEL